MRQNVPYYEADCCMIKKKKKNYIPFVYRHHCVLLLSERR